MLPKWVVDNRTSVLEEAAPYVGMSREARVEIIRKVMRVGAKLIATHAHRDRVLAWHDPLPKGSTELLARLRSAYRDRHGRAL